MTSFYIQFSNILYNFCFYSFYSTQFSNILYNSLILLKNLVRQILVSQILVFIGTVCPIVLSRGRISRQLEARR